MLINGLEKVSFVDFEGKICATVFTGGCNFRCPFCHNSGLVNLQTKEILQTDVLEYLKQRKNLLEAVVISGGEPTIQKDLPDFIKKIKDLGYLVKLDTNGTGPEMLKQLIEAKLVDYVAMDIKNNFEDYSKISGYQNALIENIKESLNVLRNSKLDYELRTTLVKEFHLEENINKLAIDLNGEKLLYLQKFVDSGSCLKNNLSKVEKEQAKKYQDILSKAIQKVKLRGY